MNAKNESNSELQIYSPGQLAVPGEEKELGIEIGENAHLRDYFNLFLRRKMVFLIVFIGVVTTVTIATFLKKPIYKSTVTIKIDRENPNILSFKDIYQIERLDLDYYQTQYRILKSRNIGKRVIRSLDLERHEEFAPKNAGFFSMGSIFGFLSSKKKGTEAKPSLEDGIKTGIIGAFINRVEVTPLQKSQLVNVSFTAYNPALTEKAANAIADAYINFNIESKYEASQQARKWLEEQIGIMKAKVEVSEERLNHYSAGNEMIFIDEKEDRQSLLNKKLAHASEALDQAVGERISKESLYREIKESGPDNQVILGSPLIQKLKEEYSTLESEYNNQLKMYTAEYPKMKMMKNQLDTLMRAIEQEKKGIIRSVEADYGAALKREKELAKIFNKQKKELLDFQEKTVQYQILKREVDTNKELYNNLLQRLKEIGVSATMTATNIQVLDRAILPKAPSSPRKNKNIFWAMLFGLLAGTGTVFFVEYLDNTVKDTQETEKRMRLSTLGLIPLEKNCETNELARISHTQIKSPLAESFRSIGTFLLLSSAEKPPKTVLVTSAKEKEGKSTIACNSAIVMASQLGKGVIIDADLRAPNLHRRLEADNEVGLSTYLSGNMGLEGLIKPTPIEDLYIITSGPIPPNPAELLWSSRMRELIDELNKRFNFTIIDSPPVLGMTDSVYLSRFADGVIIVVKAGSTPKNALLETKKILGNVNAKILGIVLNGIRENDMNYGYYSYYYSTYYKDKDAGTA